MHALSQGNGPIYRGIRNGFNNAYRTCEPTAYRTNELTLTPTLTLTLTL